MSILDDIKAVAERISASIESKLGSHSTALTAKDAQIAELTSQLSAAKEELAKADAALQTLNATDAKLAAPAA